MLRVGGFNEFSPADQIIFDKILEITQKNYKQFGYTHISTPAVERNDVLLAKSGEDASKQIFGLYGLAQGAEDTKSYSLHYDLTVPFARYVLDWQSQLTFPFKRYQIQPVWRGERQQRGRFKEFYQADIDTIWNGKLTMESGKLEEAEYLYYDAETIFVLYKTVSEISQSLNIDDEIVINISNRKILGPLIDYIIQGNDELKQPVFNLIDRFYKISKEDFLKGFSEIGIDNKNIDLIWNFLTKEVSYSNILDLKGYIDSESFNNGIGELFTVIDFIEKLSLNVGVKVNYKVNFLIVRGLDYYTGTVFETFFSKERTLGSICSGGRYEGLTAHIDSKTNYSGVGGSIGVDRLMSIISGQLEKGTIADYMFMNFEETQDKIFKLAGKFIAEGKNIEIYPCFDKFKKQLQYADKKGIRDIIILGESELSNGIYKIKNLQTGEEKEFKL